MSLDPQRRLIVEFSTEDAFRCEYATNIANGGVFVASSEVVELRARVLVEIHLSYCDKRIEIEGEVVHSVPPEMAAAGAQPGAAVQFALPVRELREQIEQLVGGAVEAPKRTGRSGRRAAARAPARVSARVSSDGGQSVDGRTRDISSTGMLLTVRGEPLAIGKLVQLSVSHPRTGEQMEVEGNVVRHIESNSGEVTAMGVEFHTSPARQTEVASFVDDVQVSEHSRRLGGIRGPIAELGIENLLQMFGSSSPVGTLMVTRGADEGFITFEAGMLRSVRLGRRTGAEALRRMLSWCEGSFEFYTRVDETEPGSAPMTIAAAIEAALGDDELLDSQPDLEPPCASAEAHVSLPVRISQETRFSVVADTSDAERSGLSKTEEAVLDLATVGSSVAKMLDVIPVPEIEVLTAIDLLLEQGMIQTAP